MNTLELYQPSTAAGETCSSYMYESMDNNLPPHKVFLRRRTSLFIIPLGLVIIDYVVVGCALYMYALPVIDALSLHHAQPR